MSTLDGGAVDFDQEIAMQAALLVTGSDPPAIEPGAG